MKFIEYLEREIKSQSKDDVEYKIGDIIEYDNMFGVIFKINPNSYDVYEYYKKQPYPDVKPILVKNVKDVIKMMKKKYFEFEGKLNKSTSGTKKVGVVSPEIFK